MWWKCQEHKIWGGRRQVGLICIDLQEILTHATTVPMTDLLIHIIRWPGTLCQWNLLHSLRTHCMSVSSTYSLGVHSPYNYVFVVLRRGFALQPRLVWILNLPASVFQELEWHVCTITPKKKYAFSIKRERNGSSVYCIAPCHQKTQLVGSKEWKRWSCVFLSSPLRETYGGVWAYSYKTLLNPWNT